MHNERVAYNPVKDPEITVLKVMHSHQIFDSSTTRYNSFAPFMHDVIGKDAYSLEDIRAHKIYNPHNKYFGCS